ncbi:MAG: NRDE family protein [Candidatus Bathyarchaeia archaeon]
MCTLITIINPSKRYKVIFLENRDLPNELYYGDDARIIEDGNKLVSLYDFRSDGIVCGYALNTGIFGGLTNVLGYSGSLSRGVLLKNVLLNSKNLQKALKMLIEELSKGEYSSANYVLGNAEKLYRIENFSRSTKVIDIKNFIVLTNNFNFLKYGKKLKSSSEREKYIYKVLFDKKSISIKDLLKIAKHHGKKDSVCRHGKGIGKTVSSVIFYLNRDNELSFMYCKGNPCKSNYIKIKLR